MASKKTLENHVRQTKVVRTGEALLDAMQLGVPDVVLLDIGLPGISGIETLQMIRLVGFTVPVVMLTMHTDPAMVNAALSAGAAAYVVKQASGEQLLTAIERAIRGETYVSPGIYCYEGFGPRNASVRPSSAQLAVLRLAARGLRAKEIAMQLGLSSRTVESHKYMLMQQLEINTTIELIAWGKSQGLI